MHAPTGNRCQPKGVSSIPAPCQGAEDVKRVIVNTDGSPLTQKFREAPEEEEKNLTISELKNGTMCFQLIQVLETWSCLKMDHNINLRFLISLVSLKVAQT